VLALVIDAIVDLACRGQLPSDLARRKLDAGTAIDELGLDSLAKLNLLSELEERADVTLGESLLPGLCTLGDLARAVASVKP
jgi:acyl carrier protein